MAGTRQIFWNAISTNFVFILANPCNYIIRSTYSNRLNIEYSRLSQPLPSLIFIPDITGFTNFVNKTEVSHGQHIIAELLEILIDANDLDLTLSEIEGDAILFYKHQQAPGPEAIAQQAEKMFFNFHSHLKKYESQRICQCGACKTAFNLTLKIIAHSGELDFIKVKERTKPYGSDLILAHRLLKNNIKGREYLLLTDDYLKTQSHENWTPPDWLTLENGMTEYENLGEVNYRFASLSPLRQSIPEIPAKSPGLTSRKPVINKVHIEKPRDQVFETVIDFEKRMQWNKFANEIKYDKDHVNQVGAKHVCVFDNTTISFETVTNDFGREYLVYGERVLNPPKIVKEMVQYFILAENGSGTNVQVETHYQLKPLIGFVMNPFLRRTMYKLSGKALQSLKSWCESQD